MKVKITIRNATQREDGVLVEDALVDTGATWTVLPRSLADRLDLEVLGQRTIQTATGPMEVDRSYAFIEYNGFDTVSDVIITDTYPGVLIGVVTLESLELAVDPKSGRLVHSDLLLL